MYLASFQALNFKNYPEFNILFSPEVNLFTGPNGSGKTNLLDAIYFICLTKSAFHSIDANNIKHKADFLTLKAAFCKNQKQLIIQALVQKGQKKVFKLNKKPYEKITEHIGSFPAVLITPYDTDLIREGSEERRKFFDAILSQTDYNYLNALLKYNKILKQRNALLKQFAEKKFRDIDLLSSYDELLIKTGNFIFEKRKELLAIFMLQFRKHYENLSEKKEAVSLQYASDYLDTDFKKLFLKNRDKDLLLQRTGKGVHKDDFIFEINGFSIKSFGSQGQQKSFVIALKLAQFEYIYTKGLEKPILLLDDIFDKLDQKRIEKLLQIISEPIFGQVFITEARTDRVEHFFGKIKREVRTFSIQNGVIEATSKD